MVEVKVIILRVLGHISIKIMLKINRERRKNWEKSIWGIKNIGPRPLGRGAPGAPPPGSACDLEIWSLSIPNADTQI